MKKMHVNEYSNELNQLCTSVRTFVLNGDFDSCLGPICKAMSTHPHAPHPHNLLGIILEKTGDHAGAMKHFKAAWALDPTYLPANHNLNMYGTFSKNAECAYDENDLLNDTSSNYEVYFDNHGIKCVRNKDKVEYDNNGIGHVVRR